MERFVYVSWRLSKRVHVLMLLLRGVCCVLLCVVIVGLIVSFCFFLCVVVIDVLCFVLGMGNEVV